MSARVNTSERARPNAAEVAPFDGLDSQHLAERYRAVRSQTVRLCEPLATEDFVVQTMPDVSPTKWHLAHTTWFFETFVLKPHAKDYRAYDPAYERLFNSYYNAVGRQYCRPKRGWLSRPTVRDIMSYREHVDRHVQAFLEGQSGRVDEQSFLIELGLQHEQQHQELILTDIKHVLASNVLRAVYGGRHGSAQEKPVPLDWIGHEEGMVDIGHDRQQSSGFAFDNESPRHRVFLESFQIASRLVTCGEYIEFIEDGGYERPELWLSDGWATAQREQWRSPLYWLQEDGRWSIFAMAGCRTLELAEPVTHISFYEADAYARWAGYRLATEAEWELAAREYPVEGNFAESEYFHPLPARAADDRQFFGDGWEWTASPYTAYPRYTPPPGAIGEYNAKFMCNQMVLRGGSCATPQSHIRATYRNFFPPDARWQFTGIRLARSV